MPDISPFLPAIGGLLSSGLNFITGQQNTQKQAEMAKYNTDRTIQANKEAANLAYQRDYAMWKEGNAYNSPAQQMQRLKAAGLNPMMAYGSGSVAGNSAQASAPKMAMPQQNYNYQATQTPSIPDLMQVGQNLALGSAQLDNMKASTAAIRQKTANDAINEFLLGVQAVYAKENEANKAGMLKTQNKFLDAEKILALQLQGVQKAVSENSLGQSKQMFPYQLAAMQSSTRGTDIENRKKLQELQNLGFQSELLQQDKGLKAIQLKLNEADLTAKGFQNKLRESGTYEGDNALSFLLRQNAPEIQAIFEGLKKALGVKDSPEETDVRDKNRSIREKSRKYGRPLDLDSLNRGLYK